MIAFQNVPHKSRVLSYTIAEIDGERKDPLATDD